MSRKGAAANCKSRKPLIGGKLRLFVDAQFDTAACQGLLSPWVKSRGGCFEGGNRDPAHVVGKGTREDPARDRAEPERLQVRPEELEEDASISPTKFGDSLLGTAATLPEVRADDVDDVVHL